MLGNVGSAIHRWRAPLAVVLFQLAPLSVDTTGGRFRVSIGVGGDSYEQQSLSCEGSPVGRREIETRTLSGTLVLSGSVTP